MKKTSIVWAASFFLIIALSAWGAQRTFTTYTWDGEVDVAPADAEGQFEINPQNISVPRNPGRSGTFSVIMSGSCAADTWTASSNASWLTISSGMSGAGNGVVTYHYTTNSGGPGTPLRIGNIMVTAASCGQKIFSLCQNGFSEICP
ncbi:MAG TPA: hypothetical protein P5294_06275 [Smithellaceae bacterium]|nr:hypothetical protein [Smithellaceae bacterium]HRS89200.1 hypothetical protein [Smithellaceae bacterium]HRV26124.1 hypothetical protein [Smithellaceae bacterium]